MISSLTAEKLACARGERRLFDNLSFCVKAGHALAVEGANGAGKTTLLRLIAGFSSPQAGRLIVKTGESEHEDGEERGKFVGWFGHQDGLKPQLSVIEQLDFYARLYRMPDRCLQAIEPANAGPGALGGQKTKLARVLEEVGLARQAELFCRYLSAGQKRRLALARLLVCDRALWLLDEPFAALDRDGQALVARLMARHCSQGGILIAATHEPLGLGNEVLRLGPAEGAA
jgi:heme exporter protein A